MDLAGLLCWSRHGGIGVDGVVGITEGRPTMSNTIVWTDIPVVDLDRAIQFYSAVFDTKLSKEDFGGISLGVLPHAGEGGVSGCLVQMEDNKPSQYGPLIYLNVDGRLEAASSVVEKNGGKVLTPKHSIRPYGFRAIIADSEGNRIALHSQSDS
jgi:predicted enzyme related to lactoylglutathione lyase